MAIRELTSHKLNGLNDAINICVMDRPGAGGASHHYRVEPIRTEDHPQGAINPFDVKFQNGPIGVSGVNGCSNESLLAIVIDRLECFQTGQHCCRENAIALMKLEEAMYWLQHRTRDRLSRGVEGTSLK